MAREHIRAFLDVAGVTVVGICSRTRSRAERLAAEFRIGTICDSVPELYECTRANLVVVCVNELSVEAVSAECFRFPWTILVEKPAGHNVSAAARILQTSKDLQAKTLVALNRRSMFTTLTALEDLSTDAGPRFIYVQDQEDLTAATATGQPAEVVTNWMFANSIHLVDYLRVFGRGEVMAVSHIVSWNADNPFLVMAKIEFASGDVGIYQGVWNAPGPWAVVISTPRRRWEMRPLERICYQDRGDRTIHEVEIPKCDFDFKPGLRRQAEMAAKSAVGLPSEVTTLDDAFETMMLIQNIFYG